MSRHEDFPGVFETDGDRYDAWCDRHPGAARRVTPYDAAFACVLRGGRFTDLATLALTERGAPTIAHVQVLKGWTTTDPAVLALATPHGFTVADAIREYAQRRVTP